MSPAGYADAFVRLSGAGILDTELARRLAAAAGFRDLVAHAYDSNLVRVHDAATHCLTDLRAFLAAVRDWLTTAAHG